MAIIYTNKGEQIIVDDHRFDEFNQHIWTISNHGYAVRRGKKSDGERAGETILLHREVIGASDEDIVDHMDRCKTNNLESNLRFVTRQQNQFNSRRPADSKNSEYKGVYNKDNGSCVMQIQNGDKKVSLTFSDEIYAATAYDYFAKIMFGEYAVLNGVDIPKEVWSEFICTKWSHKTSTSKYKGVCLRDGKWVAQLYFNEKQIYIGRFETENDAAVAYNIKAIELFGEDAELNNIEESDQVYIFTIMQRPISKSNMYKARSIGKRAIIYTTKELEEFEILIGSTASQLIPKTLVGLHSIYARYYTIESKPCDTDNGFKALLDGMDNSKKIKRGKNELLVCDTGIENDRYFQLIVGERIFVENKEEEKIEVLIAPYESMIQFAKLIEKEYSNEV